MIIIMMMMMMMMIIIIGKNYHCIHLLTKKGVNFYKIFREN